MARRVAHPAAVLVSWCLLVAVGAPAADARLTFEREDGSTIRFDGVPRVWCGPWAADVPRPSIHVRHGTRRSGRGWWLRAVRRDIEPGRRISFPNSFIWNRPRNADLFVSDGPNPASTGEEESSGSMVFSRAGCRCGSVVAFRIRAVLGSEYIDGERIRVSGRFRGRVRAAP